MRAILVRLAAFAVVACSLAPGAGGARAGDLIGWQGETHVSQENPDHTNKEGVDSIDPNRFAGACSRLTPPPPHPTSFATLLALSLYALPSRARAQPRASCLAHARADAFSLSARVFHTPRTLTF